MPMLPPKAVKMPPRAPSKLPAKAPLPVRTAPKAPPAPSVRKAPVATAPLRKLPPVRSIPNVADKVCDVLTVKVAKQLLSQLVDQLDRHSKQPWIVCDGKKTELSPEEVSGSDVQVVGYWLSVYHDKGNGKSLNVSISQLARRKAHAADTNGVLCERNTTFTVSDDNEYIIPF